MNKINEVLIFFSSGPILSVPSHEFKLAPFTVLHYAVTTKVKAVNLCLIMDSIYRIQCSDTVGIVASRCSYVLVSVVEGLNDIIGTIAENSYMNEDIPVLNDYYRILVYNEDNLLVMNETFYSEKIGSCNVGFLGI